MLAKFVYNASEGFAVGEAVLKDTYISSEGRCGTQHRSFRNRI